MNNIYDISRIKINRKKITTTPNPGFFCFFFFFLLLVVKVFEVLPKHSV